MRFPLCGAVLPRSIPCAIAGVGLILAAGCARYDRRPLAADDFQHVLEARRPGAPGVVDALGSVDYDVSDGLSLDEAELLALYLNPRLRAVRVAALIPEASARYAGLWDDPEVGADALRVLEDVDEPWLLGASLSFTIPVSGRLAVAKAQATAEARAALAGAWAEEQAVLHDLRGAWADWEAATRSLTTGEDLLRRLVELVAITNRREELGEIVTAEASAFRLAEARLRLDLEDLRAGMIRSRLAILSLIGLLPTADVPLAISGTPINPGEAVVPDGSVYSRSPAVILSALRFEAAEESLRLEVRKQYPDLSLGPMFGYEDGTNRLGVGFSVPIPILNANRQGIAVAEAARNAARADWEQAVQESLSAHARARHDLEVALGRAEILRSLVVPLANEQINQVRRMAEAGELDTLLVLGALQSERESALDLIEAEAAIARAQAAMKAVMPGQVPVFRMEGAP